MTNSLRTTELLTPLGDVQAPASAWEVRQIDVWFAPIAQPTLEPQVLGLLGRIAGPCLLNLSATHQRQQRFNCLLKLFELHGELQRQARRDEKRLTEAELPGCGFFLQQHQCHYSMV